MHSFTVNCDTFSNEEKVAALNVDGRDDEVHTKFRPCIIVVWFCTNMAVNIYS